MNLHRLQNGLRTVGRGLSWCRATSTYLFFERRRERNIAIAKLVFSLNCHPNNWSKYWGTLENYEEKMAIWMASGHWGLDFKVDGKTWGGVILGGCFVPWRRRVYKIGKAALRSKHIKPRYEDDGCDYNKQPSFLCFLIRKEKI